MPCTAEEMLTKLVARVSGLPEIEAPDKPWIVPADRVIEVLTALRDEPALAMKSLMNLTAVDRPKDGKIEIVYHLCSMEHHHRCTVKTAIERDNPHLPTAVPVWPAADWHEREVYDLFGVIFEGHPDLRRILCPDDWVGHPLRKDYVKAESERILASGGSHE